METEPIPVGYPDFRVTSGDDMGLGLSPGHLMFLALHRLSDVRFFTASFSGEDYFFEPWITALVSWGRGAVMTGVYCVDEHDEVSLDEPSVCLLQMHWDRATDLRGAMKAYQAGGDEGYKRYLREGPQIATTHLFGNGSAMSDVLAMTDELVGKVASGVTITTGKGTRSAATAKWEIVDFNSTDTRFLADLHYSPAGTNCLELDAELPHWLQRAAELVTRPGLTPDDKPILSIHDSVKEVLRRPVKVNWEALVARFGDYLDD